MDLKTRRSVSERLNVPLEEVLYMPIFRRGQKQITTTRYDNIRDEQYMSIIEEYGRDIDGEIIGQCKSGAT